MILVKFVILPIIWDLFYNKPIIWDDWIEVWQYGEQLKVLLSVFKTSQSSKILSFEMGKNESGTEASEVINGDNVEK